MVSPVGTDGWGRMAGSCRNGVPEGDGGYREPEATQAAYVNYTLIANEVVMTEEIVGRLKKEKASPTTS